MPMPEVQEYSPTENPLDWFGDPQEVLPSVPDSEPGDRRHDVPGGRESTDVPEPKSDGMTVGNPLPAYPAEPLDQPAAKPPKAAAAKPFKVHTGSIKSPKIPKVKGFKAMPFKMKKMKGGYTTSTPGGVKGKGMTLRNAKAQEKLLNALDHGWKKPKKNPEW
jgi:hypothetical protein